MRSIHISDAPRFRAKSLRDTSVYSEQKCERLGPQSSRSPLSACTFRVDGGLSEVTTQNDYPFDA
jgi:hypothetical protein